MPPMSVGEKRREVVRVAGDDAVGAGLAGCFVQDGVFEVFESCFHRFLQHRPIYGSYAEKLNPWC